MMYKDLLLICFKGLLIEMKRKRDIVKMVDIDCRGGNAPKKVWKPIKKHEVLCPSPITIICVGKVTNPVIRSQNERYMKSFVVTVLVLFVFIKAMISKIFKILMKKNAKTIACLLYTSPSPRDRG